MMREDFVHVAVRRHLRARNWQLIAGQYPNGSDNELGALCIVDPSVACDNSPDPRRHSQDKIVPDLVGGKANFILLIEMKPSYSAADEQKLVGLLTTRRDDLVIALSGYATARMIVIPKVTDIVFVPCLGFAARSKYPANPLFCYFAVHDLDNVTFTGNQVLPSLNLDGCSILAN
jgi:hypothetical protein